MVVTHAAMTSVGVIDRSSLDVSKIIGTKNDRAFERTRKKKEKKERKKERRRGGDELEGIERDGRRRERKI